MAGTWGGLNPALTVWRAGINARFPKRGTQSDGGYADKLHGSTSEHQPDADGSVDAFDCDVNFLGSSSPEGTAAERRIAEALKLDFELDRSRAQLWIHRAEIANRDVSSWKERAYGGPSPHTHHIHFQSRQAGERAAHVWTFRHTDALRRELGLIAMTSAELQEAILKALESDRGQKALRLAAGVGVHSQEMYRSDMTIATGVLNSARGVERIEKLLTPPPVVPAPEVPAK